MTQTSPGLMDSAKRLLSTLVSIASTRLELLANEFQEERLRLMQLLFLGLFAFFCFGMCILLLTMFFVVLFWDDHRLAVLGSASVFFFASGSLLLLLARAQAKSTLFSASLAELSKDREKLKSVYNHHEPS